MNQTNCNRMTRRGWIQVGASTLVSSQLMPSLLASSSDSNASLKLIGDLRKIATNELVGTEKLSSLSSAKSVYGIGMLDGLDGELLILDSKPMLGAVIDGAVRVIEPAPDSNIAFGAFSYCDEWETIEIPDNVRSFSELETFSAEMLEKRDRDLNELHPVRLNAKVDWLQWFIVRGMGNLRPTPRDSFVRQWLRGGLDNVEIEATGVFSRGYKGIAMNKTANLHLHFVTQSNKPIVAHLDDSVQLRAGSTLMIAKIDR
jgi:hypothetical protein